MEKARIKIGMQAMLTTAVAEAVYDPLRPGDGANQIG